MNSIWIEEKFCDKLFELLRKGVRLPITAIDVFLIKECDFWGEK